jgi:formate-dependent nitrite reductase cytochrome c552 subunit
MRIAAGFEPMRPELARLPMAEDASGGLGCATCHGAHAFDTAAAQVDACLGCHADEHSLAYRGSPHQALWERERMGSLPAGSGVSCATCHLPRVPDAKLVRVHHNPNDTLRPNEKMIRPVCMECHGLGFSIDSLADAELVRANFAGRPADRVESIEMARSRVSNQEGAGE